MIFNNKIYNSSVLYEDINYFKSLFPFLETGTIGYSVLGKPIPYIKIGNGPNKVLYAASFHANEFITTNILMKFIYDMANSYQSNFTIWGYNARNILSYASIYIVPLVNPDGIDLVTGQINSGPIFNDAKKIASNYPKIPFPLGWKANIRGVDLNLQFPAGWYNAREIKFSQGFNKPAPRDFVGFGPLTEPESLAIYNFTLSNNFRLVISYHTQGKEIYWNFQNINPPQGLDIANTFAYVSGYSVEEVPYNSSFAGFKDWFIQDYKRPGFTIEAGLGINPLPLSQFDEIYYDNLGILVLGAVL